MGHFFHTDRDAHSLAEREHRLLSQNPGEQPRVESTEKQEAPEQPAPPEQAKLQWKINAAKRNNLITNADAAAQEADAARNIAEQGAEGLQRELGKSVNTQRAVTLEIQPETATTVNAPVVGPEEEIGGDIGKVAKEAATLGDDARTAGEEPQPNAPEEGEKEKVPDKRYSGPRALFQVAAPANAPQNQPYASPDPPRGGPQQRIEYLKNLASRELGDVATNKLFFADLAKARDEFSAYLAQHSNAIRNDRVLRAGSTKALQEANQKIQALEAKIKEQEGRVEKKEEPKTIGEKLERDMQEGMEKGDLASAIRALGAFFQYIQRSFNGTLDEKLAATGAPAGSPEGGQRSPEQLREQEAKSALRKEIKDKGGYDTLVTDITKERGIRVSKLTDLRDQERDLRGEEGRLKTSVEALQRRIDSESTPAKKEELQALFVKSDAELKTLQVKIEGVQKQTAHLEKEEITLRKKLDDMEKLKEQAEETKTKIEEMQKGVRFMLEGLQGKPGMTGVGGVVTLVNSLTVEPDPVTKVDIKLQLSGGATAEELRNTVQKFLEKVPSYEELGIDAGGKIVNPEKFTAVLTSLLQKLEGKEREETTKREKAKKAGEDFLGEKHANQLGDAFQLKSGTLEATFKFDDTTGAWQWKAPGQALINVPQDFFPGTSSEATFLNDVAKELHRKTS